MHSGFHVKTQGVLRERIMNDHSTHPRETEHIRNNHSSLSPSTSKKKKK
jgi:hypothetical protein